MLYLLVFLIGGFFGVLAIGIFAGVRVKELENRLAAKEHGSYGKVS